MRNRLTRQRQRALRVVLPRALTRLPGHSKRHRPRPRGGAAVGHGARSGQGRLAGAGALGRWDRPAGQRTRGAQSGSAGSSSALARRPARAAASAMPAAHPGAAPPPSSPSAPPDWIRCRPALPPSSLMDAGWPPAPPAPPSLSSPEPPSPSSDSSSPSPSDSSSPSSPSVSEDGGVYPACQARAGARVRRAGRGGQAARACFRTASRRRGPVPARPRPGTAPRVRQCVGGGHSTPPVPSSGGPPRAARARGATSGA